MAFVPDRPIVNMRLYVSKGGLIAVMGIIVK